MCAAAPARAPSPVSLLSSSLASRVVPCVCPLTDEARGRPTLARGGGAEGDRRLTAGDGLHGSAPPSPSLSSRPPASSAAGHPARDATGPGASEKRAGKVKEGDGSRALVAPRLISAGGAPLPRPGDLYCSRLHHTIFVGPLRAEGDPPGPLPPHARSGGEDDARAQGGWTRQKMGGG